MAWPLSQDYNEAIQDPAQSFSDPELRGGQPTLNALGLPMPRSGNFADVYEVLCPESGNRWAVKCFTREVPGLQQRYAAIGEHLARLRLPFAVEFHYLEQGLRIRGQWYPVLKMRWVEGLLLNEFVRGTLEKPTSLEALAQVIVRMGRRLREAQVAHGDLQHGNIILVPASNGGALAVKLIDYDGMFVPALARSKSGEVGHPSYQHPQRLREAAYGADVDRFPLLLLYAAIRSLRVGGRALWDRYDNGDNLLFREQDLRRPAESPLFKELWQTADAAVHDLAGHLALASVGLLDRVPLLDQVLIGESVLPLSAAQEAQVTRLLGPGATVTRTSPKPRPVAVTERPASVADEAQAAFAALTDTAPPKPVRKASSSNQAIPLWVGAAVAVGVLGLVAGVAFIVLWGRSGRPTERAALVQNQHIVDTGRRPTQPEQSRPAPTERGKEPTKPPPEPPRAAPAEPDKEPTKPPPEGSPPSTKPEPAPPPREEKPTPSLKPQSEPAVPKPVSEGGKLVVPEEGELAAAEKEIKAIFVTVDPKRKPPETQALAARLLQAARDTKDQPAARYVLLREARDLAAKAGDLALAMRAAASLSEQFAVSAFEAKTAALDLAGRSAPTPLAQLQVAELAVTLAEEAEAADDYEAAARLVKVAQAAPLASNKGLATVVHERSAEVEHLGKAYTAIKEALRMVADKSADADANLAVGRFLCLQKGDWDKGATLLAKGGNAPLKDLATKELAGPTEPSPQVELGDGYKALAEGETGTPKTNLLRRACWWYEKAEAKLAGLGQGQVTKKIAEISKALPSMQLTIEFAKWGADTSWVEVLAPVRARQAPARGQPFNVKALELGIPDPAFGKNKSLVIVYRYRDRVGLSIKGDASVAAIPAGPTSAELEPGKPTPGQELVVLYARYGADDQWGDGTSKAQALVKGPTLTITPGDLGLGDPAPNKHKAMVIVYRYGGGLRLSITGQDETAVLGAPTVRP
jgi:hypothetical protein